MLSSLKGKEKDVSKKILCILGSKIQRHSDDRELNQVRAKAEPVDRSARTARTFVQCVQHYSTTQHCSTETVFLTLPFLIQRLLWRTSEITKKVAVK